MKKLIILLPIVLFILLFTCCKKDKAIDPAIAGYKITLVEGDHQSDTIGKLLKNQLIFKATYDGDTLTKGYVRIGAYNCDSAWDSYEFQIGKDLPAPQQILLHYQWRLNGKTGVQQVKAILLDSLKVARDSVTVTANGIPPAKGWYASGCLPERPSCSTFSQLPSGRILTALAQTDYPYYSDDEGITWYSLKTLPAPGKYKISKIITTPLNEVFLTVYDEGMYYSANGGQTWEKRNTGLPPSGFWGDIYYTKSSKLFCLTSNGVYLSADKGLHWHTLLQGLYLYAGFSDASSLADGKIFAIHDRQLMQSDDGGESWKPVYPISGATGLSALFVDDNDDIYVANSGGLGWQYGLYVSKDKGQTWAKIYTVSPPSGFDQTISAFSKQNGIYYFYASSANVLTKTTNFINYTSIYAPVGNNNGRYSFRYLVTSNNHLLLGTEFYGLQYYIP